MRSCSTGRGCSSPGHPAYIQDFAQIWQAADKIVYSRSLETLSVGGPALAAHAFKAGLVDESHLFLAPVVVGGGKQSLPDNVRLQLELVDDRRFRNGMVYLRYHTKT